MKNQSPELPPVTYKEAIKLLNSLCEGLGDEAKKLGPLPTIPLHVPLSDYPFWFSWMSNGHKVNFWEDFYVMIMELESGAGIKQ